MGDSKNSKTRETINPDTRLHSDEMRETYEKNGRLARNPNEITIAETVGGVMTGESAPREVMSGCNLQCSSTLCCPTNLA